MEIKKGLIIQGPIISKGRTGESAQITFSELTESDIVEYNCIENILNIFNTYSELFDHIVVVTWEDQDDLLLSQLKNALPEESLLLLKDTTRPIEPRRKLIPGNNKYRLFYSIYEGTKFLSDLGCELTFKIRSDQFLDLNLLVSDTVSKLKNEKRNTILVPWVNIKNSYSVLEIPDHYFSAKTQDMLDFTQEYLELPEIFEHVHTDIFFKWSLRNLATSLPIRKYIKFTSRFGNNIFLRVVINKFLLRGCFIPLDKNILNSLYWRGKKFFIPQTNLTTQEVNYSKSKSTSLLTILLKVKNKLTSS